MTEHDPDLAPAPERLAGTSVAGLPPPTAANPIWRW